MKKFMMMIMFVLVTFGVSYGAELYTVKEVREEMRAMKKEFRADINKLEKEMRLETESQRKEIEAIRLDLYKMSGSAARLSQKIDDLEVRFMDLRAFMRVCMFLVAISLIPSVQKFLEWRDSRKLSITLEDVKRLIEKSKSEARNA